MTRRAEYPVRETTKDENAETVVDTLRRDGWPEINLAKATDAELRQVLLAAFEQGTRLNITNGDRTLCGVVPALDMLTLRKSDEEARKRLTFPGQETVVPK